MSGYGKLNREPHLVRVSTPTGEPINEPAQAREVLQAVFGSVPRLQYIPNGLGFGYLAGGWWCVLIDQRTYDVIHDGADIERQAPDHGPVVFIPECDCADSKAR